MKLNHLEIELKQVLSEKFIKCEEYQDKYYLWKRIKKVIPDLPDTHIYETIEQCAETLKSPIKKNVFIKSFLNQNFPILYEKI